MYLVAIFYFHGEVPTIIALVVASQQRGHLAAMCYVVVPGKDY